MMLNAKTFEQDLRAVVARSPQDRTTLARFFKTGKGEYGEGDVFIGVTVPAIRQVCKKYKDMALPQIEKALESPIHEVRLGAVIVMAHQAEKAEAALQKALYDLYLQRTDRINNWDIVDSSAEKVVGCYLLDKPRDVLYKLARSQDIWERRIAIISTFAFIKRGDANETYKIAELLLKDKQDLIHKAAGWMLREAGKRVSEAQLKEFLDRYAPQMPRTMLRYAIERLDTETRSGYMAKG